MNFRRNLRIMRITWVLNKQKWEYNLSLMRCKHWTLKSSLYLLMYLWSLSALWKQKAQFTDNEFPDNTGALWTWGVCLMIHDYLSLKIWPAQTLLRENQKTQLHSRGKPEPHRPTPNICSTYVHAFNPRCLTRAWKAQIPQMYKDR